MTGVDLAVSTSAVVPLSVVVPLAGAALMAGFSRLLPRWARDLIAIAVALTTTALTLILVASSAGHPMIYWFSGWRPSGRMVIGIDYVVGPLGAGMASLAGVLASAALVYTWRYFDSARGRHHALVLIFLAASVDFCLTGDLSTCSSRSNWSLWPPSRSPATTPGIPRRCKARSTSRSPTASGACPS